MSRSLTTRLKSIPNHKVIFCDFFDTIVHRTVHPNYVIRLWSKTMIKELGLDITIDELYFIRKDVEHHLSSKNHSSYVEIPYSIIVAEVYERLVCSEKLQDISLNKFSSYFKKADLKSEISVQYLNSEAVQSLKYLKERGHKIYIVSDFYLSTEVVKDLMKHHNILELYDDVFVSADIKLSKHNGSLYPFLLDKLGLHSSGVVMIGDNKNHDIKNAEKFGLETYYIPNNKQNKTSIKYVIGSDYRDFKSVAKRLRRRCNSKKALPNSDYILFYTVFIERLYHKAKKEDLRDLFFMSREGLYLKKLFDFYQAYNNLEEKDIIKTHYYRTSRQASMLVSLNDLENENFTFLRNKYPDLSLNHFFKNFNFDDSTIDIILEKCKLIKDKDTVIVNFLDSDIFNRLKSNTAFITYYDNYRLDQKQAFENYLKSFNVDFIQDGMHIVDIGWGGTMQECLYDYFNGKVNVFGYYLGIREIYNIHKGTKRFGLNFSVYPYATYSDNILRGNIEMNEQLLSAPHGSVISYSLNSPTYTNEYHHPEEKRIYDNYISKIQDFMFVQFKQLLDELDKICYDSNVVQKVMTDYALKIGIFASKKNIIGAYKLSEGFYTNVGNFSNGLVIGKKHTYKDVLREIKMFIFHPDKLFRYMLRVKPLMYSRNKYYLTYLMPSFLLYFHIKLNRWIRKNIISKITYLKYAYLR